jgi:hypothetical protein
MDRKRPSNVSDICDRAQFGTVGIPRSAEYLFGIFAWK